MSMRAPGVCFSCPAQPHGPLLAQDVRLVRNGSADHNSVTKEGVNEHIMHQAHGTALLSKASVAKSSQVHYGADMTNTG